MKQTVYIIIRTVTTGSEERRDVVAAAPAEHSAKKRMSELVSWYEGMKDEGGQAIWACNRLLWDVAKFTSRSGGKSFRLDAVEREVEI